MFQKTYLKLAGFYLLIMMVISVFFSVNLYRVSVREFDRDKLRRGGLIERLQIVPREFIDEREQQIREAKERILNDLIFTNICILIASGVLSYYLARRTLEPIEKAHEAQSRFTADASHELRTPIAAMRTEIEVTLMNPKLTLAQAKTQLKSNLEELDRLTLLSEGLLKLAQLEHDKLEKEEIAVGELIDAAVSSVAAKAEEKHILIQKLNEPNEQLFADRSSLVQALVVVLDNAIKYSPEKTEISIGARVDHKNLILDVSDQGVGIKEDEMAHIFDRFYRADNARNQQQNNGYGLGLAIAKNILEVHGGTITVRKNKPKGTIFTLRLPTKV